MAVLTVDVLGDHNLRAEPAVLLRYPAPHGILTAGDQLIGILQFAGVGIAVTEVPENGIVPNAQMPQAVQGLAPAGRIAGSQINHLNIVSPFRTISRDRAAGKQQFIIRMSNQKQKVRLLCRRLPALNPFRNFAFPESIDLVEPQDIFLFCRGQNPDLLQSVQLIIGMIIKGISLCDRNPFIPVLLLDYIALRQVPEAEIQSVDRFIRRNGYPRFLPLTAFPECRILAIRDALNLSGLVHHFDRAAGRQVFCFLRPGRDCQQQQRCQQQKKRNSKSVHFQSFPLSLLLIDRGGFGAPPQTTPHQTGPAVPAIRRR